MVEPSQGRTTMFDIISSSTLQHLLLTYGYVAVFFVVAIESMGMPVPGEMTLMAASVYAGTTHHLQIGLVVLAAGAGAILGDNVGYLLGRKGGLRLLQRYGPAVRLDDRSLGLAQNLVAQHGGTMVFIGRFFPVLRIWAGILAGSLAMPWRRFLACNAAGGLTWATLMGLGTYTFGQAATRLGGLAGLGIAAVGLVLAVGMMLVLHRSEYRMQHGT